MNTGEWVCGVYKDKKYKGFLLADNEDHKLIQSTVPAHFGIINVPEVDVWPHEEVMIWMDDIPTLIEASLAWRDKEWFMKWTDELSQWHSVTEFEKLNLGCQ